jgi:hypothetical protein
MFSVVCLCMFVRACVLIVLVTPFIRVWAKNKIVFVFIFVCICFTSLR